MLVCTNTWK